MDKALLIVNPLRGGRVAEQLARMQSVLGAGGVRCDVRFTEHQGHALELASQGVLEGYETVVAVGGDGTVNEVVNAVIGSEAVMGALPLGAGNDFLRSLGIWSWKAACGALVGGTTRVIDLGLADYLDEGGERRRRYYGVLADVGFGSEVVCHTPQRFKHALGGGLGYVVSLYRTAVRGRTGACRMQVTVDGNPRWDERLLLVEALNGMYAGGGLKVAPKAELDDGLLDMFMVRAMPWPKICALFPKIYRGTHIDHKLGEYLHVREVAVEAEEPVMVSVDGEVVGRTPARFTVVPEGLRVRCPRGAEEAL